MVPNRNLILLRIAAPLRHARCFALVGLLPPVSHSSLFGRGVRVTALTLKPAHLYAGRGWQIEPLGKEAIVDLLRCCP